MNKITPLRHEIIFLNRAYNDIDIQLSLIAEFAADKNFNIRVIGYPCDGEMGIPGAHEGAEYIAKTFGITFETVLDSVSAPLYLRIIYKLERALFGLKAKHKEKPFLAQPLKYLHVGMLTALRKILKGNLLWLDEVTKDWNPAAIIMDEAFVQKGRSYMIDKVLPEKIAQGVQVHVVQTGQTTYADANPNKAENTKLTMADLRGEKQSQAKRFMVPSALDKHAINTNLPLEKPEIHGNLRMDCTWIERLHKDILVPPYMNKPHYMNKLPRTSGPRVVFMLSKLGYGIEIEEMIKTIKTVANMDGISCAIKPHTRGMKFDFMEAKDLPNCVVVPEVPSTLLIEWSDIVLFTGSSIAFHSLVLGKRAGFLAHCQYLETTFDDGAACDKFDSLDQLTSFLEEWRDNGEPSISVEEQNKRHVWQIENIHGSIKDGRTAKHYKDIIVSDLQEKMTA